MGPHSIAEFEFNGEPQIIFGPDTTQDNETGEIVNIRQYDYNPAFITSFITTFKKNHYEPTFEAYSVEESDGESIWNEFTLKIKFPLDGDRLGLQSAAMNAHFKDHLWAGIPTIEINYNDVTRECLVTFYNFSKKMVPVIAKMVEGAFDATTEMNGAGPDPAMLNQMMRNTVKRSVVGKIFRNIKLPLNITRYEIGPYVGAVGARAGGAKRSTRRRKNKKYNSKKRKQTRRHA